MERKEAIEVVRKNYPHVSESGSQFETALRTLVPELVSEDERMKEAIKEVIRLFYGEPLEDEAKEMIAWLEKQGEQNLANSAKTCKEEEDWSEEDERLCRCLIKDQEKALDDVYKYGHPEIISDLKEMYRERIAWLKSLKDRVGCEVNCTTTKE